MSTVLPPEDEVVLQYYRQHSSGQPSAELDARILAAAREAMPAHRSSRWARLGEWLNAASLAQRGSLAFGSLASVALVLGLVWQGLPERSEMMEKNVMAPAVAMDPPTMQVERPLQRQLARPASAAPSAAASAAMPAPQERARHMAAAQSQAQATAQAQTEVQTQAKRGARMAGAEAPAVDLDGALQEVLQLRETGRAEEAEQRLAALRERYSRALLLKRLAELEQRVEQPAQP